MGNKNIARFDSDKGHPWDVVMDRADEIFEVLRVEGFSSQDIAHIGLRLTHEGNFMWIVEGTEHMKSKEVKMMECDKCKEKINRGIAGSEHKVNIIDVTADNINEVIDDIDFPKDEMGLREFLEDNKRHHRRGHQRLMSSKVRQ